MEKILLPQAARSVLEICVAPCITARAEHLSAYVIGFSLLGQYNKFEKLCKKLAKQPATEEKLSAQAQLSLGLLNVAPVLSCLAILDIQRLQSHTSIDAITIPKMHKC